MLHGMKGKKRVEEQKRWTKLKNGFGWRTTRKVKYTCTFTELKPDSSYQTDRVGPEVSQPISILTSQNISNISNISNDGGESGGARIESESYQQEKVIISTGISREMGSQ